MVNISWTLYKVSNERAIDSVNEDRELLKFTKRRNQYQLLSVDHKEKNRGKTRTRKETTLLDDENERVDKDECPNVAYFSEMKYPNIKCSNSITNEYFRNPIPKIKTSKV